MKMNRFLFFIVASLAFLLVSCQEEDVFRVANEADEVCSFSQITVDLDAFIDTRVHVDEATNKVVWDKNDTIGVYSDMEGVIPFVLESGNSFKSEKAIKGKRFYAFFPYSNWPASNEPVEVGDNNVLHINVPGSNIISYYTRYSDPVWTVEKNVIPMVGKSVNNQLTFKQTMGMLHFKVKDLDQVLSVIVTGNNHEVLSGPATIDLSSDNPVLVMDTAPAGSGSIGFSFTDTKLPDGHYEARKLAEGEVLDVYVPVPVGTYSKGFSVKVRGRMASGEIVSANKKTEKSLTVKRASMSNYTELDLYNEFADEQAKEKAALIALYKALNGDSWNNHSNWCSDEPISTWYGIGVQDGHVSALVLPGNGLKGDVPAEIGDLANITYMDISYNEITSIPKEISNLKKLTYQLNLSNTLVSELPDEIGEMNISILYANNTPLKSLPKGIGNSKTLTSLTLSDTKITSLPDEIANISTLRSVSIYGSYLKSIPECLMKLKNLTSLAIFDSDISGTIPTSIFNLTNLVSLQIGGTGIYGSLPAELGNLTNLQTLHLVNNALEGSLPVELGKLSNLTSLSLIGNHFSGTLPDELANLSKLEILNVSDNLLNGTISSNVLNSAMWGNLKTVVVNPQRDGNELTYEGGEVAISEIVIDKKEVSVGREDYLDLGIHLYPGNATAKDIVVEIEDVDICRYFYSDMGPRFYGGSKLGETTVTIRAKGSDAFATCKVTNRGIIMDQELVKLNTGETFIPTYTKIGNVDDYKWFWFSNDEFVAKVDHDGKVTAVDTGETYVYVLIEGTGTYGFTVMVNSQEVNSNEGPQGFTGQQGQWDY